MHGELGTRFVARETRIGDARGRLKQVLHFRREPATGFEIFTANLDAHARIVALVEAAHVGPVAVAVLELGFGLGLATVS